jgi:hypothetical protein
MGRKEGLLSLFSRKNLRGFIVLVFLLFLTWFIYHILIFLTLSYTPAALKTDENKFSVKSLRGSKELTNIAENKDTFPTGPLPTITTTTQSFTKSIFDYTVRDIRGNVIPLIKYKNKRAAFLIVNVASQCGHTKQTYKELAILHDKYFQSGLEIMAFPCNQFNNQEPKSNREINKYVTTQLGAR